MICGINPTVVQIAAIVPIIDHSITLPSLDIERITDGNLGNYLIYDFTYDNVCGNGWNYCSHHTQHASYLAWRIPLCHIYPFREDHVDGIVDTRPAYHFFHCF